MVYCYIVTSFVFCLSLSVFVFVCVCLFVSKHVSVGGTAAPHMSNNLSFSLFPSNPRQPPPHSCAGRRKSKASSLVFNKESTGEKTNNKEVLLPDQNRSRSNQSRDQQSNRFPAQALAESFLVFFLEKLVTCPNQPSEEKLVLRLKPLEE